jgi:hypothetical protein
MYHMKKAKAMGHLTEMNTELPKEAEVLTKRSRYSHTKTVL